MNRWGKTFVNFSPGIDNRADKAIRQTMRNWQLDRRIDKRIASFHAFRRDCPKLCAKLISSKLRL